MKKGILLYILLFAIFLLNFSLLTPSIFADDTYVGFYFCPQANRSDNGSTLGSSHSRFLTDFQTMVDYMATYTDINTIVFEMNLKAYHWQTTAALSSLSYPAGRGFTRTEIQQWVAYIRQNHPTMKIVVALEVLSHLEANAFAEAYPGYMVNEGAWQSGKLYMARSDFVENDGSTYKCIKIHNSSSATEPGVGASWTTYWQAANRTNRDPFDEDGEELMFNMVYELIDAFTIYGARPEAFNITSDEAYSWLKIDTGALTYAETFAMAINNAYNYIHDEIDSSMDVMVWGDMLDPINNGDIYQTSDAINDISTNIIIADWRYDLHSDRFDFKAGVYPSVKEFTDKGFDVITASWMNPEATEALVWTGNMAEADGGTILGNLYTTWNSAIVPYITWALENPDNAGLEPSLAHYDGSHPDGYTYELVLGVANSINATSTLVGATQCAQNDSSYGSYPDCTNANDSDGFYGTEYRDYYYDSGLTYDTVCLPFDPVSYWDFEGNADDRMGSNDGTLCGDAAIVTDSVRGKVLELDGSGDYVNVADDDSLDVNDVLTISCWFKPGAAIADFNDRAVLVSKDYDEYELMLYPLGRVFTFSSNGVIGEYESGISSYNPEKKNWDVDKWYHIAWVMDGKEEYLYLNGEMIGAAVIKDYDGTRGGTDYFAIGKRTNAYNYFNGRMDDVMFFHDVLSPAEIKYLYLTQDMPAPIGYWDFEGDADDRVGNNDGILAYGAYVFTNPTRGEDVLTLDGVNDTCSCGDPAVFRLSGSRTITAWINPDTTNADYMMIAGRYLWGSSLSVINGRLRSYMSSTGTVASSISSTANITTGEWQHVAMTFDINEKIIRLFRNGEEVDCSIQQEMEGTPTNVADRPFTIGVDYNLSRYYFDGMIDDVKFFDFALTPEQISIQYQQLSDDPLYLELFEQQQAEEALCLDIDFDEGTGTTVYDDSEEENDGVIVGSNWGWVTGAGGTGYSLDIYMNGADTFVNFGTPASLELSGSRSISAWVHPDTFTNDYNVIAGKYVWGFCLFTNSSGNLKGYVAGTGATASSQSSTTLSTSGWQHVVMTFDYEGDKKVHLYVDGEEVSYSSQTTLSGSPVDNSSKRFTIGADYTPRYYFDGRIDQVKVFDRAVTPRQVMYYYLNCDI